MVDKYSMAASTAFYSESPELGFSAGAPGVVTAAAGYIDAGLGMGTPTVSARTTDPCVSELQSPFLQC